MRSGSALAIIWFAIVFIAVVRHMWNNPPETRSLAEMPMEQYKAIFMPKDEQ